jgi:hypothetical protein
VLRPDSRDQFQATGLGGVAVLEAFPCDHGPVVCTHLFELRFGRNPRGFSPKRLRLPAEIRNRSPAQGGQTGLLDQSLGFELFSNSEFRILTG